MRTDIQALKNNNSNFFAREATSSLLVSNEIAAKGIRASQQSPCVTKDNVQTGYGPIILQADTST